MDAQHSGRTDKMNDEFTSESAAFVCGCFCGVLGTFSFLIIFSWVIA